MALASHNSLLPTKSSPFPQTQSALYVSPSSLPVKSVIKPISAVHSADSSTSKTTTIPAASVGTKVAPKKWALDSWKSKKALQLPEYPNQEDLESVLRTLDAFPPIVFAGEARSLEERLGEAAMGNAFLLQGGDCAESFKEFNANNIRDTFRILLQMGAVLMFGGQMPVIKV
ncbi:Phospho-2-dehydro-3-deoxyheptonate aldolase 1, chloroplastic [Sesamum angolense]|uniref:Phospho-2-dehydro-3-deoxyheptonate aldolase n=2 Tax=Sesamum TaxID=4181 RepID=A0AAE1W6R6_9LAMI|nr:Phospho-2-dehydro-3-deoxyheptonate aldolase 1, chloroplastic [Sesamum angolense]